MQSVTFDLTLEEAVVVVNLVGSFPTSQNIYPLWVKLRTQVEPMLPKPENAPAEEKA